MFSLYDRSSSVYFIIRKLGAVCLLGTLAAIPHWRCICAFFLHLPYLSLSVLFSLSYYNQLLMTSALIPPTPFPSKYPLPLTLLLSLDLLWQALELVTQRPSFDRTCFDRRWNWCYYWHFVPGAGSCGWAHIGWEEHLLYFPDSLNCDAPSISSVEYRSCSWQHLNYIVLCTIAIVIIKQQWL